MKRLFSTLFIILWYGILKKLLFYPFGAQATTENRILRLSRSFGIFLFSLVFVIFSSPPLFGEGYEYYSKGKRDPFVPLITGTVIKYSLGLQAIETIEDIILEGIILDPHGESIAVLNGEIVKEGDRAYNIEIVKIYYNAVTIKLNEKVHTINLVEEGGETVEW